VADRTDYINIVLRLRDEFANNLRRSREELTGFREDVDRTSRDATANMDRLDRSTDKTARSMKDLKAAGVDMSGTLGQKILDVDQNVKKLNERLDEQHKNLRRMKEGTTEYEKQEKLIGRTTNALRDQQFEQNRLNNLLRNNFERSNQIERQQLRVEEAAKRVAKLRADTLASDNKILDAEKEMNALARELVRLRSEDGKVHASTLEKQAREIQNNELIKHQTREIADIRERGERIASRLGATDDPNAAIRMRRELEGMINVLQRLGKTQEEVNEIRDEFTSREMVAAEERASKEVERINKERTQRIAQLERELADEEDRIRKERVGREKAEIDAEIARARARTQVVIAETERERAAHIKAIKDREDAERTASQRIAKLRRDDANALKEAARTQGLLERADRQGVRGQPREILRVQAEDAKAEALRIRAELETAMAGNLHQKVELDGVDEAIAKLVALREAERLLTSGGGGGGRGGLRGWISEMGDAFNRSSNNIAAFDNFLRGLLTLGIAVFFNQLIVLAGAAAGALTALASSALYAGGALGGGLVAGIAQALPVLGVLGAAIYRWKAVMDAANQSQLLDQQQSYKGAAQNKKLADSTDQVANAQGQLADAHRRVTQAQKDLTQAREDARDKLQDLILAEKGQALSAVEAQAALRRALSSGDTGAIDRARLNLETANVTLGRTRRDLQQRRSARGGPIEGSPEVTRAAESLRDAERAANNAARGLDRAKRGADIASANVTAAAGKLDFLLGRMSASERRMYETLKRLQDEFRHAAEVVTEPLTRAVTGMMNRIVGILRDPRVLREFTGLSQEMADQGTALFNSFTDRRTMNQFFYFIEEAKRNLKPLRLIIQDFGHAFLDIAQAASPALRDIFKYVGQIARDFSKWTSSKEGQRTMTTFFREGVVHLKAWMQLFGAIGRLFMAIAGPGGGAETGLGLINRLTGALNRMTDKINKNPEGVRNFFKTTREVIEALMPIVHALGDQFVRFFGPKGVENIKAFSNFIANILIPALGNFLAAVGDITRGINWIIDNVPGAGWLVKWVIQLTLIGGLLLKLKVLFSPIGVAIELLLTKTGLWRRETEAATAVSRWGRLRGAIMGVGGALASLLQKIPGLRRLGTALEDALTRPGGGAPGAPGGGGVGGFLRRVGSFGVGGGRGGIGGWLSKDLTGGLGGGMVAGIARATIWGDVAQGMVRGVVKGIKEKSASAGAAEALKAMTFGKLDLTTKDYAKIDKATTDALDRIQEAAQARARAKKLGVTIDVDFKTGKFDKAFDDVNKNLERTVAIHKQKTQTWSSYYDQLQTDVSMQMKYIRTRLGGDSEKAKDAIHSNFMQAADSIRQSMIDSGRVTKKGMELINKYMRQALSQYGITGADAESYIKRTNMRLTGKAKFGEEGSGKALAGGGWVGKAGERGRDMVHTVLGRGEAVLNHAHQRYIEPAVNWFYGHSLGDTFKRVKGYHAGGAEQPGFAAGGYALGGVHAGIRNAALAVLKRFPQLMVTSTTGGGHAANSYHYRGMAVDIGGAVDVMRRAAAYIKRSMGASLTEGIHNPNLSVKDGKSVPSSFWGATTWANHANHIHLAVAGALGKLKGVADRIKIPRIGVDGGGTVGATAGMALGVTRRAAQDYIDRLADQQGSASAGDMSQKRVSGGMGRGAVVRVINRAMEILNVPENIRAAWRSMAVARAYQESGFNPNAQNNWDSNAAAGHPSKGLFQTIDSTFSSNAVRGHTNILAPLDNTLAAFRYMLRAYGRGSWALALSRMLGRAGVGYATGGEIPGGEGEPTPILAHAGEWIVNRLQQSKLAGLLGMGVGKLKSALGFTGGPGSFAGGGEVPAYARVRREAEDERHEQRLADLKRHHRKDEIDDENRLHQRRLKNIKEYEEQAARTAKKLTDEQIRRRNIAAGIYSLPTLMPDTLPRERVEAGRVFRATGRNRGISNRSLDRFQSNIGGLINEGGLLDTAQTLLERWVDVAATKLKAATYKMTRSGNVIARLKPDEVVDQELKDMHYAYEQLVGQGGTLNKALRGVNARLKRVQARMNRLSRGGIQGNEREEYDTLRENFQNLVGDRRNIQERLRKNAKDRADALEALFQKQLDQFKDTTDEALKKTEENAPGGGGIPLSVFSSVADAIGRTSDIRKVQAQQLQNYKDQVPQLEAAIKEADSKGYTEYADQLRGQLSDVWGKIQTATEQSLKNAIEDIDAIAGERNRRSDLRDRIAGVVALVDPVRAAGMREAINAERGTTLVNQRDALLGQIGGRDEYNRLMDLPITELTDVQKTLIKEIGDADTSIEENTAQQKELAVATRQATIDAINNRASFGTGVLSSLTDIVNKVGAASGQVDNATLTSIYTQTQQWLAAQFGGLASQFKDLTGISLDPSDPMSIVSQMQTVLNNWDTITAGMTESQKSQLENLITAILGNTSATLDNNDALKQLTSSAFDFSTTAWTRFRQAIFTGMGTVLPQYPIPQMQTGGYVTKSGIFQLHAGEHVINPRGGVHAPVKEGDINIEIHEAGGPIDSLGLAKRISWERGSRK